ncbi:glutamine-hydrolyzing GMP synthase [bacterium]|nr:glutamine-hydrolyzing GMP synthase [bacterium]
MTRQLEDEKLIILDFGSQYTQLIARRIRELKVYCEILSYDTDPDVIKDANPKGIILSGGPSSVYGADAPLPHARIFQLGIPILGICYGLQVIGHFLAGEVDKAAKREFGSAKLKIDDNTDLFETLCGEIDVWMSHGDHLTALPVGFEKLAHTENAEIAAVADRRRQIYGIQFHPEVVHTPKGSTILKNFLFNICDCEGNWTPEAFVSSMVEQIRTTVKKGKVLCGLSGGVDSAVTAGLIRKAIGDQLIPVFVDNGLLRKGEARQVRDTFKEWNLRFIDASQTFLSALEGKSEPEEKRKIIGHVFIDVFEAEAEKLGKIDFLAQGTLYPDVIESVSTGGPSQTIKSHHNVGGLPEKMKLKLVEPLRELFKDEVRAVGRVLGLPDHMINRHPFPGPGLGIRIIGDLSKERLDLLREADFIFIDELRKSGWYDKTWQALAVLLPVQSVGVMGDERTYEFTIALRAVNSLDGMTANWTPLPYELLGRISNRIINEVRGINRVVYDISSKPPATIEWE